MNAEKDGNSSRRNDWKGRGRGRRRDQGSGRGAGPGGSSRGFGRKENWSDQRNDRNYDKDTNEDKKVEDCYKNSKNSNDFQTKKEFSYSMMIPESELGITEYISKGTKIKGVLKQRFSDFIVHEIDQDGNIVKLTNLEVPEEKGETSKYSECEKNKIIPEEKWTELINLLEKPKEKGEAPGEVKLDVTDLDKDSRRNTHAAIRNVFGRKLQSDTRDEEGRKIILVKKWTGSDPRGNWTRPKNQEYLHFVVHKQDMDTSETVNEISYRLRFKPSNLNFAGTKDRRACTTQKMSLWHGEPKRFRNLRIRNVWIGNYEFKDKTLKLGQLSGNLFSIVLRNISNTGDEEVNKNMTSLKENGFINYFGTQRFGTNKDAPTHAVGRALLQADWEKAVNLILHPRGRFGLVQALECWHKEKDAKKASSLIKGSRSSVEASLLRGLAGAAKNDYLKALNALPRNLRLLYLHAYQSFVWNRIVSRRIQQFGLKVLPGDLTLRCDRAPDNRAAIDVPEDIEGNLQIDEEKKSEAREPEPNDQDDCAEVRVISAEEVQKISIDKIVLPTPGFKITLPDNECKNWYAEMLAEDGFTMESMQQKSKEYSVGGSYRNFVAKATQLDWKIVRYKEPDAPLLRTDAEELEGKLEPQDDPEGKLRALVIKIGLSSSTYATMALREVADYVGAFEKQKKDTSAVIGDKNTATLEILDEKSAKDATEYIGDIDTNQEVTEREFAEDSSLQSTTEVVTKEELVDGKMDVDSEEKGNTNESLVVVNKAEVSVSGEQAVTKREADEMVGIPSKKPKLETEVQQK